MSVWHPGDICQDCGEPIEDDAYEDTEDGLMHLDPCAERWKERREERDRWDAYEADSEAAR